MKARSLTALVLVGVFFCTTAHQAEARRPAAYDDYSPDAMLIDAVFARPLCLVATVVGTGIFVVSLPITAITGSTYKAAKVLVGTPADLTFKRKLGKLSTIED